MSDTNQISKFEDMFFFGGGGKLEGGEKSGYGCEKQTRPLNL